jgi:hypothetical protein
MYSLRTLFVSGMYVQIPCIKEMMMMIIMIMMMIIIIIIVLGCRVGHNCTNDTQFP